MRHREPKASPLRERLLRRSRRIAGARCQARSWACACALALQLGIGTGAAASPEPLRLELVTGAEGWLPQRTDLELRGSRPLEPGERLVVEIGGLDLTDLFRRHGSSLIFRSDLLPLPAGASDLSVSLHRSGAEPEVLLETTLHVRTRHGLDAFELSPSLDLEGLSQVDSGRSPEEDSAAEGPEEATGQIRLGARLERSGWRFSTEISLLAVTEIESALRFGEKGEEADKLDLSSYLFRLERGRSWAELGHTSYGDQRYLISGFSSRGLGAGVPLGGFGALSLFAGSGSQIVGFDDVSGLSRSEHQVRAASIEISPFARAKEALVLELSYLDGSLLPLADFNQGLVNDAEESHGFAVRARGRMGDRGSYDLGYAKSSFTNPADPFLDPEGTAVATEKEEKAAYYGDLDFVLFRRTGGEGWDQELTLSLNHEHVEPLYRSTAAFATADFEQSRATLNGVSGPIAYVASHSRSEDNLDDIPSILKTKTRAESVSLVFPLGQIWGKGARSVLLPTVSFSTDRTKQYGAGVPENGGFSASHVPDQVSLSQIAGLEWQGNRWRLGYALSYSDQDNRQVGRENDDFKQLNHSLRLDLALAGRLDLGFEFSRERAESVAEGSVTTTERPAFNLSWQATEKLRWGGSYSLTETEGPFASGRSRVASVDGSYRLSWREEKTHGMGGQVFLRYDSQDFEEDDRLFGFMIDRREWTIQAGLNLSLR
ncbi:MAG: hypothetical protein KDD47_08225 [Acidobacteria bacterium]|nr:hypothetical protein [Acidobacteriota bacterium]